MCFCTSLRFTFLSTLPSESQLKTSTIPSYESLQCLPLNLRSYKQSIIVCIVELQPFLHNSCLGKVFHNFFLMVLETTSCVVLITFVPMAVLERHMRSSVRVQRELNTLQFHSSLLIQDFFSAQQYKPDCVGLKSVLARIMKIKESDCMVVNFGKGMKREINYTNIFGIVPIYSIIY